MSKRHADSTPDEKAPKRRKLSADSVLVEAARNGDTTAVRAGLEKLSPDTDSKTVAFDAVHEACRGNHDECLALLLPYVETTQMGFGMLLSECVHADHTACTEVLLQHWKSVCSNVAFVPHGQEYREDRPCPAMWEDPAVCQVLIDAGADIETKDDMGRSPLHWSCRSGALDAVKMLVEAGAGVRGIDSEGSTCLIFAASSGHTETVCYLAGLKDVDLNHSGNHGRTALHCALKGGYADVVEVLIDAGADIEARNNEGGSALHVVSAYQPQFVKMLVRAGAGVRATDNRGDTCLLLAADFGNTETVRYLVNLPEVDVNHRDSDGCTAVLLAAWKNHPDVVEVLIDAGADMEVQDEHGHSPLHLACCSRALAVVKMLVRAGAGVRVTNNGGGSCLELAATNADTETVRTLLCMPEVDVNQSNDRGYTPLHFAVSMQHSDVVQLLIDAGADIEAKDVQGTTPLHCACSAGELDIVQKLLKAGADVCVVDDASTTCLMFAALQVSRCTKAVVGYLAGLREVDVNQRDWRGLTALSLARQNQHTGVVQVLLEHGAEE